MRASTVIKSIPTSETRTQASMTMPLSSTRSRTSIRLVPPAARSTDIVGLLVVSHQKQSLSLWGGYPPALASTRPRQRGQATLKDSQLLAQLMILLHHMLAPGRQV